MALRGLVEADYVKAASLIGCDVAAIKAVDTVESRGAGFLPDGKVKILFEPHIFWQQLKKVGINPIPLQTTNADILYPKWVVGKYGKESAQWGRLERAMKINKEAALASCSWGRFQIMGFNFKYCGFNSVNDFVEFMKIDEDNHLEAFVKYVKGVHLDDELIAKMWDAFAESYNGPSYKKNNYDTKLANAYKLYKK